MTIALKKKPPNNVVDLEGRRQETREQVLERLFREHASDVRAFLRMRMGADDELEDVLQEVFIRVANMDNLREKLAPGREDNRSYLFTVANNLTVDLERYKSVRRNYAERLALEQHGKANEATPEIIALNKQELARVKDVIMELKPNWRQAFVLSRFKYLSYPQIASEMGVSVKQVEKYMKQALMRIRDVAGSPSGAKP
ncbi:RNA polymerase sigma factor [Porticoccaceae bacterium LTM1]|nr:RNA polymerase sigma factor [Porticoccaceae bacterium LTM1]